MIFGSPRCASNAAWRPCLSKISVSKILPDHVGPKRSQRRTANASKLPPLDSFWDTKQKNCRFHSLGMNHAINKSTRKTQLLIELHGKDPLRKVSTLDCLSETSTPGFQPSYEASTYDTCGLLCLGKVRSKHVLKPLRCLRMAEATWGWPRTARQMQHEDHLNWVADQKKDKDTVQEQNGTTVTHSSSSVVRNIHLHLQLKSILLLADGVVVYI